MVSRETDDRQPAFSLVEILRPILFVAACAAASLLLYWAATTGATSQPHSMLPWRTTLLFLGCTVAVIAFQVFFVQYFEMRLFRRRLLTALKSSEAEDAALLAALSRRTGVRIQRDEESGTVPSDIS